MNNKQNLDLLKTDLRLLSGELDAHIAELESHLADSLNSESVLTKDHNKPENQLKRLTKAQLIEHIEGLQKMIDVSVEDRKYEAQAAVEDFTEFFHQIFPQIFKKIDDYEYRKNG